MHTDEKKSEKMAPLEKKQAYSHMGEHSMLHLEVAMHYKLSD